MNEQTRAPRRTAEQWQAIVEQQIQSGLSGAAFCKAEGIKYQSFMNWRTKLAQPSDSSSPDSQFIELTAGDAVHLPQSSPSHCVIELDLAPGVQLRITR